MSLARKCFSFLFFLFICFFSFAQTPNYLWTKGFGGDQSDMGRSVAIDLVGNSVVTGGFNSSYIVFGSDTLFNSGSAGMEDFFLAKLDAFGSPIWAIQAVGVGAETGNGVAIDALGNITVVGTYTDTTVVFGSDTLPGPYGTRAFIARYDASGNELWAKTFSGTYQNQGQAVCNDTFGNIFFTGSYRGASVTFDTLAPFASSFANDNAYLIKMDPSGNALWGKSIGGNYLDEGTGVACDPVKKIFPNISLQTA